jgi:hypothetical protein
VSGSDHARRFILKVNEQSVAVFAVRASFLLSWVAPMSTPLDRLLKS